MGLFLLFYSCLCYFCLILCLEMGTRVSPEIGKWSDLLISSHDKVVHEPLLFSSPSMVEGERLMIFSDEEIEKDVKGCQGLVVWCFVGKRLPF